MRNRMRRTASAIACMAWTAAAAVHAADGYPSRPIRVIVPLAPGGGSDYTARFIGQRLAERTGQPVVVDKVMREGAEKWGAIGRKLGVVLE